MTDARFKLPKLPTWLLAVAPFLDLRSWGAVIYLWLSFPLGLFWFVGLVVGFAVGLPLTILWIGFAILAVTLAGAWLAAGLERQLAIHLLGADVPPRIPLRAGKARVRDIAVSPALWKGLLFLGLRFPFGLVGWVFSIVSLAISSSFLLAPWVELTGFDDLDLVLDIRPVFWNVDTPLELWQLSALGYGLLVVSLHTHRAMGWAWARLAEWLLGAQAPALETEPPSAAWTATESSPAPVA